MTGLDLHGAHDGFVVTYDGKVVDTFPTWDGAANGLALAKQALTALEALLSPKRPERFSDIADQLSSLSTEELVKRLGKMRGMS